jgi:hypothetical protein
LLTDRDVFSSPCQRQSELLPSLVIRRPLTFHILIFSSETPQPNEVKLGRKRLWKVLSKNWNKNCLWWPCLLTDRDEMSNLYRGHAIDASYQVSVQLAKRFQRRRLKCEKFIGRQTTDDPNKSIYVKVKINVLLICFIVSRFE